MGRASSWSDAVGASPAQGLVRPPADPGALGALILDRVRRLSLQATLNALPRVEERLELTLVQLGNRFGRVTPGGIALRVPLTH